MKTQHTPGPWHVEPDQPSHGCSLCIVAADALVVARTPEVPKYGHPEQAQDEINAQLLAAAPDLLAALQALLSAHVYADAEGLVLIATPDTTDGDEAVALARAAITKATVNP